MTGDVQAQPYYGMDSYDDRKSYDKRSYGNDNGYDKSQYQSSYKLAYPSYGKDDKDKSKDNKSVDIKKIKCNNININLNNGNTTTSGNGDNGNTTSGNGDNGNNTDRFKKINRDGFTFICINNNNNEVGAGGGGNAPTGNRPSPCVACFENILNPTDLATLENAYLQQGVYLQEACDTVLLSLVKGGSTIDALAIDIGAAFPAGTAPPFTTLQALAACVIAALGG